MSTIENESGSVKALDATYAISQLLPLIFLALIVAVLLGIVIGYFYFKKKDDFSFSLEKFILIISGAVVAGAIISGTFGFLEQFSSAAITVFSSIIFSWLLTKASNKDEWKKQEQELALRSYRHIDYIETASNTARQTIDQYISGDEKEKLDTEGKLILSRAMDYIGYIQGGIYTCKLDWVDLMSDESKKNYPCEEPDQKVDININQEDA